MKMTKTSSLQLKSSAFREGGEIPEKYTFGGGNIHPPLQFSTTLRPIQSFALIMEDPDIIGGPEVHWLVWNIDPALEEIEENVLPPGALQGVNSFGEVGYHGPSPLYGTHRYYLTLYALDALLALPEGSNRQEVEKAMQGHILQQIRLTGKTSGRPEINQRKLISEFSKDRD